MEQAANRAVNDAQTLSVRTNLLIQKELKEYAKRIGNTTADEWRSTLDGIW